MKGECKDTEAVMRVKHRQAILASMIKRKELLLFEYFPEREVFILYDGQFQMLQKIEHFMEYLQKEDKIHPEDKWKMVGFCNGEVRNSIEIRYVEGEGLISRKNLNSVYLPKSLNEESVLLGSIRDVTIERRREEQLQEEAQRDPLTKLYNKRAGTKLIEKYLRTKDPYSACGLMIIDVDYFKDVNDNYGHLFGDVVLKDLAKLLLMVCDKKDVVMRAGGDEFVILFKDIPNKALVRKAMQLVHSIRNQTFQEKEYSMTCSIGVCYLPENVSGYTYEQILKNADWALYRAKENGRDQYVFCDSLQRFQSVEEKKEKIEEHRRGKRPISGYRGSLVATAFETFEKAGDFDSAVNSLLEIVGKSFNLDRITVFRTDIKVNMSEKMYQWTADNVPQALEQKINYKKEDFLKLFYSYDENGTTVLQEDEMKALGYSEHGIQTLLHGDAKTAVHTAIYYEGKYAGSVSYMVCKEKRSWKKEERQILGEITKIIAAHLGKLFLMNSMSNGMFTNPEFDDLTGLISFTRFKEEVERVLANDSISSYVMVYTDFENFKYFNQKWGYQMGDRLLREFSNYIIGTMQQEEQIYFTRVVSDQFLLFMPYKKRSDTAEAVDRLNQTFVEQQEKIFPDTRIRIRTGIYFIEEANGNTSIAIDAANYARKQVSKVTGISVKVYGKEMEEKQRVENEIINGFDLAMRNREFKIYLQPRVSLFDYSIIGAEAVVRWQRTDGTVMIPDAFIPLYERNGRIIDLDFFVFEEVVKFLAENKKKGRKLIPISVNASILHARDCDTVEHYLEILNRYGINPALLEIELTETATVSYYDNVKRLFERFQKVNMQTALDDFGSGYSLLNTVIDIPVNTVKIDKVFMDNCKTSERGMYFLHQIVAVVKGLGYRVVCEGVENLEQVEVLRKAGCEEAQGFWFAHPMPVEEFEQIMYQKMPYRKV